jgi:hypothetical protein
MSIVYFRNLKTQLTNTQHQKKACQKIEENQISVLTVTIH